MEHFMVGSFTCVREISGTGSVKLHCAATSSVLAPPLLPFRSWPQSEVPRWLFISKARKLYKVKSHVPQIHKETTQPDSSIFVRVKNHLALARTVSIRIQSVDWKVLHKSCKKNLVATLTDNIASPQMSGATCFLRAAQGVHHPCKGPWPFS